MSELKVYHHELRHNEYEEFYLKSEADKVIALLTDKANYNEYAYKSKSEELADTCRFYEDEIRRHKKEVEQLLMEIMNLKHSLELASNECCSISERGVKNARHHKYKRCLAMASYWVAASYQCVDDKHRQSAERHHRKWQELAEKFKEAK